MVTRPLPPVIGVTENALRSLLGSVLEDTLVEGYAEWVILNLSSTAGDHVLLDQQVADVLKQPTSEVLNVRRRLATAGLTDRSGAADRTWPRGVTTWP